MDFTPVAAIQQLFWLVLYGSAPTLIVTAVAGLTIAIIQGVTQINDQTVPQVVKTGAACLLFLIFGAVLFAPIYHVTLRYFEMIPMMGK